MRIYQEDSMGKMPTRLWKVRCDKCMRSWCIDDGDEAIFEMQEFLHWENDCGYGSIFGDGSGIEIDLCQECVQDVLGPYLFIMRA